MRGRKPGTGQNSVCCPPSSPSDLSERGRDRWRWWIEQLADVPLRTMDQSLLRALVEAELIAEAARAAIAEDGAFYHAGELRKQHPAVNALRDATATIRQILVEMNLTPARRGAKVQQPTEDDAFDRYLRGEYPAPVERRTP